MGLDHWLTKCKKEDTFATAMSGRLPKKGASLVEIVTWRKNYAIHDYFFDLYQSKGGRVSADDFNCIPVEITLADLDDFEEAVREGSICKGWQDEDRIREICEHGIDSARKAIQEGYVIFYDSWW